MVSPKGLHVTGPDAALRCRSWDHIRALIDLCADLGPDGVMVFGSPKQRATTGGLTREQATRNYVDGLAGVAPHARRSRRHGAGRGAARRQCDVVQTLDEAAAIVQEIGSPAIRTMFDVHNAIDEAEPHAALVDRYFDFIRHVHVNELDGRHCGAGRLRFQAGPRSPAAAAITRAGSRSRPSISRPAPERLANESLRHLENGDQPTAIMSHYIVTGGAGFIGSAIVRTLLDEGASRSRRHR